MKIQIDCYYWGRGKCPECERKYQKDMRLLVKWENDKIIFSKKMCSWCMVLFICDCRKEDIELDIKMSGNKEKFKNQWNSFKE